MIMLIVLLGILGAIAVGYRALRDDHRCPVCHTELTEVGYDEWKKQCKKCGWRNFGRDDVLSDEFLEDK